MEATAAFRWRNADLIDFSSSEMLYKKPKVLELIVIFTQKQIREYTLGVQYRDVSSYTGVLNYFFIRI